MLNYIRLIYNMVVNIPKKYLPIKRDLILRDGISCSKNFLTSIKKDGVVILGNSDRKSYEEGYNYLSRNGYKRIDFEAMGPVNVDSWCTSIFYKDNNCLEI